MFGQAVESSPTHDLFKVADLIDTFCGYPSGHSQRVADLSESLASPFNLAADDMSYLKEAALIRGAGILQMAREYISADRVLTDAERLDLSRHPVIAEQAAGRLGLLHGTQFIVRWQHEWWSGRGYPDGLSGVEIPIAARILRVADSYMSMISERPFRKAYDRESARKHLIEWTALEFDPAVIKVFFSLDLTK